MLRHGANADTVGVVEIMPEMNALLDLFNPGELRSYIDSPEHLGCPASRMERICCLEYETIGVWCC